MKNKLGVVAVLAVFGAYAWHRERTHAAAEHMSGPVPTSAPMPAPVQVERDEHQGFQCDGRKYCSQMSSCDEARFFLRNCPDPKMDGDNDGIPCEDQLCGHQR